MKYYAGIGGRDTPKDVSLLMTSIAKRLSGKYVLNSGGAIGADSAFEKGALDNKQIFLPWNGFNNKFIDDDRGCYSVPPFNEKMVRNYHPKPKNLSESGWKFMSRNSYQVLGADLKTPVDFVLCWTKDGKASGGTGQALRIAKDYNIPVFNFKNIEDRKDFSRFMLFSMIM